MRRAPVLVLLAALGLAAPAAAGDFLDTTITFVAGDDNALADAGATIPSSPRPDFRPRATSNLFFDNYDTRNTGEETRTHLVLYKSFEPFFERLTPEAALVLEWDLNRTARDIQRAGETGSRRTFGGIREDGSYLAVHYATTAGDDPDRFSVVLFPFDSDRFRLGYSWELTYGGRGSFILASIVPALRLSYESRKWYTFVGAKTARTQVFTETENDPQANENEAIYAVLAGAGVTIGEHLILEANGGYFQKGNIPIERRPLLGDPIDFAGGTVQVTWADGIKPTRSVDTKLYRNLGNEALRTRTWGERAFGYLISSEATLTSQVLENAERLGQSKRDLAYAGDVNAMIETGIWSFSADFVLRSVQFLVQDTPGLFPFSTIPEELEVKPEWFAAVGAEARLESLRLVPSLTLGIQQPAVARVVITDVVTGRPFEANLLVRKTKSVLGDTAVVPTPLPAGEEVALVYSGRLALKSHLSDLLSLIGEVQLSFDQNLVSNDPERGIRTFDTPWILGFAFIGQARF